eukprot:4048117-Alexandrium_andersonii.AAC.1
MSASLVGSEMCIRDRCRLARLRAKCPRCTGKVVELAPSVAISHRHLYATVSYTHLTLPTICSV